MSAGMNKQIAHRSSCSYELSQAKKSGAKLAMDFHHMTRSLLKAQVWF